MYLKNFSLEFFLDYARVCQMVSMTYSGYHHSSALLIHCRRCHLTIFWAHVMIIHWQVLMNRTLTFSSRILFEKIVQVVVTTAFYMVLNGGLPLLQLKKKNPAKCQSEKFYTFHSLLILQMWKYELPEMERNSRTINF